MSILCLICKEKLVGYSLGGVSNGSFNQLVENVIISTSCGHLYHQECLQSWFRTQKLKKQGADNDDSNVCPSCLARVKEEENRRIFLFEDHLEALERAKILERHENLEIYCHQLEVQLQQLQHENDYMVNKILTPPTTPSGFDTIVKNDRVRWMRSGESPVSGVVLNILKKDGKLSAKIRLDRKIRTTQRNSRLFSSFRSDKKQEVIVPFDEIALEKDHNENTYRRFDPAPTNIPMGMGMGLGKASSTFNLRPTSAPVNFRHSTISLQEDSRRLYGINEAVDESSASAYYTELNNRQISMASGKSPLNRSVSFSPGFVGGDSSSSSSVSINQTNADRIRENQNTSENRVANSTASLDQQRDYVIITPQWANNKSKQIDSRNSPPDSKKHVTFADDRSSGTQFVFPANTETPYANFPSPMTPENEFSRISDTAPTPPPRPDIPMKKLLQKTEGFSISTDDDDNFSSSMNMPSPTPMSPQTPSDESPFQIYPSPVTTLSNESKEDEEIDLAVLLNEFDDFDDDANGLAPQQNDCYAMTLLSLFYGFNGLDQQVFRQETFQDSEFRKTVAWIIREKFVLPLRHFQRVQPEYSFLLQKSLSDLCSETLDVEELMTILFEFVYQMPPFIKYSLAMCDFLHQFFIDYTDKVKVRTVLDLLGKSLLLQDNLKIEETPDPALILQIPHSGDEIVHYDAVIPNLTMDIGYLIEGGQRELKNCYCDKDAKLECKSCKAAFCGQCIEMAEEMHKELDHDLEICSLPSFQMPSVTTFELTSIICLREGHYSAFLKDGRETYSPWIYVHNVVDGQLQIKNMPGFGYWLESLLDKDINNWSLQEIPPLLRKVLQQSKVFIYAPIRSSEI